MKHLLMYTIPALLISFHFKGQAQQSVLFEAGATYFTNNFPGNKNYLGDFAGFTFNTRVLIVPKSSSSFALEFPFSVRSKFKQDNMIRFGLHLPVLFTYSYGGASSGIPSGKGFGFTVGTGWGYFHQQAKARNDEIPQYKQSVSVNGPEAMFGIRVPVKNITLFRIKNKPVHPAIAIKFTHLFDLKNTDNNIGSLSALIGFAF